MRKLDGEIAILTGGSAGIGLATARRFAGEGALVYLTGRRQAELESAVAKVGHGAVGVPGDVAKAEDMERLYDTVHETDTTWTSSSPMREAGGSCVSRTSPTSMSRRFSGCT